MFKVALVADVALVLAGLVLWRIERQDLRKQRRTLRPDEVLGGIGFGLIFADLAWFTTAMTKTQEHTTITRAGVVSTSLSETFIWFFLWTFTGTLVLAVVLLAIAVLLRRRVHFYELYPDA